MALYIKVIFWNVTNLKVWLYTDVDFVVIASVLGGAISAHLCEHILLCRAV